MREPTTSFDFDFQCPNCRALLHARNDWIGKQARCKKCGESLTVHPNATTGKTTETYTSTTRALQAGSFEPALYDEQRRPPIAREKYWLLADGAPAGPFDCEQVRTKLVTGEINGQTRICLLGEREWQPLTNFKDFAPPPPPANRPMCCGSELTSHIPRENAERRQLYEMPADSLITDQSELRRKLSPTIPGPPWNPVALAWLALPFTPMWAGVMALLNNKRLGTHQPAWIPLGIGFGCLIVDAVIATVIDSMLLSLLLYCAAVFALWQFVFRIQVKPFHTVSASGTGRWRWPVAAGAPLALLLICGLLMPLEPREVCERFNRAWTASGMAKYSTANLLPAVEALAKQRNSGSVEYFELTDEGLAPADVGGYLVGFRGGFRENGQITRVEGVYHLVYFSEWKIEDIYFVAVNQQPLDPWVSLANDYQVLLSNPSTVAAGGKSQFSATSLNSNVTTGSTTSLENNAKYWTRFCVIAVRLIASSKGLLAVLAGAAVFFVNWAKPVRRNDHHRAIPTRDISVREPA